MNPLKLSDTSGYLFRRAQQAHVAAWQRVVSTEISSVQFGVLNVLSSTPGSSQRELCDELDIDRTTIGDVVARLESRGLVQRVRDERDLRKYILRLTERGAEEHTALLLRTGQLEEALTGRLTEMQRDQLHSLLWTILRPPQIEPLHTLPDR